MTTAFDAASARARIANLDSDDQVNRLVSAGVDRDNILALDDLAASDRAAAGHAEGADDLDLDQCSICGDLDARNGIDYYWHPAAAAWRLPASGTDAAGRRYIVSCPQCGGYNFDIMPNTDPDPASLESACRDCGHVAPDDDFREYPA